MTTWRTANDISQHVRFQRAELRAQCKAGASLAHLINESHPALEGVRCYQLLAWLPSVRDVRATRLLRGLPGHLRLENLTPLQRELIAERCQAYEDQRARSEPRRARERDYMRRRRQPA